MHALVTPGTHDVPRMALLDLLNGFRATCIVATAIKLGILDQLHAAPASASQLADRLRAHRQSLQRFLRALEVLELVKTEPDGFALTSMGRSLVDPNSGLRERAILTLDEYLPAWLELGQSVMTGAPAFPAVFGMSAWEHRKAHPDLDASFNRMMADHQAYASRSVLSAYDFAGCGLVVDVGGGRGALMAEILARYPDASGLVFDQPHVVERAREVLAAFGVLDRCRFEGGSFLDSIPSGGEVYILQYILHDWGDSDCATILRNCRAAMGPSSELLVIENLMPEDLPSPESLAMLDLQMMVVLGGRERTLTECRSLLHSAGLDVVRCVQRRGSAEIIVAAPEGPARSKPAAF
jgi:hypothetical protein